MRHPLSAFCGVLALVVASAAPALTPARERAAAGAAALADARLFDPAFAASVRFDRGASKLGYPVLGARPEAEDLAALYGAPDLVERELAPAVPAGFDPARWPRVARAPAWPWREVEVRYYGDVGFGVAGDRVVWVTNRSAMRFEEPRPAPAAAGKLSSLAASPYDGNWSEGDSGFSFTVVNGTIVDAGLLEIDYASCDDGGSIFSVFAQPVTIEGNRFAVSIAGVTDDNVWIVTNEGTFRSDTAASGEVNFLVIGECGFLFGVSGFDVEKQPDYVLYVRPAFSRIFSGQSTSFEIAVDPLGGFNQPVAVEVLAADADGVDFSAFPSTIMPGGRARVDVTTEPGTRSTGVAFLVTSSTGRATHRTLGGVDVRLFLLRATPDLRVVTPGQSATYMLTSESAGFTQPATLGAEVFPSTSNVQVRFDRASIAPGEQTTVTVTTAPGTVLDLYGITISGTAGGTEERAFLDLDVTNGGFAIAVDPATITVARGQKVQANVAVDRVGSFAGPVTVTAPNLKTIKLKVKPGSAQVSGASATFTIKAKPAATPGRYQIVFTARAGEQRRTATLIVVVE